MIIDYFNYLYVFPLMRRKGYNLIFDNSSLQIRDQDLRVWLVVELVIRKLLTLELGIW